MTEPRTSYVFDNDRPTGPDLLDNLSAVLDELTIRRLVRLGVAEGWRCLEVGAGNGSIAGWLADRTGSTGQVLATDIKPLHVRSHPAVTVLRHDLLTEDLPPGPFRLIHARLVLAHLPQRCEILTEMVERLLPGGALLIEEWGAAGPATLVSAADPHAAALYERYQRALLAVLTAQGNHPDWALRVPAVMVQAGLANVDIELYARSWRGGSAGCLLSVTVARELRGPLIAAGISGEELDRLARVLVDSRTLVAGNLTVSTIGYRR